MGRWPKDNVADQIKFYGLPGPEVEAQLVKVFPPFKMYYSGKAVPYIKFHKKAAGALNIVLKDIWEHYGCDQSKIDLLGISSFAGAYNPRPVRGYPLEDDPYQTRWSNHAFGAAIDLNASQNGFGKGKGNIPQPVIDAFKRQGARWGGDYKGRTDPMHFEFCDAGQPMPPPPPRFVEAPQADNNVDPADAPAVAPEPTQAPVSTTDGTQPQASWLSRKWKAISGLISGGAATGALGFLTSPWAIVAVFGCLLVVAILIVLFMGPNDVRAWVRKQVS